MRKSKTKTKRISKKSVFSTICFLLIVAVIIILYFKFPNQFNTLFNKSPNGEASTNSNKVIEAAMKGDLRIHMVDVGQGDAIIIEFPDGQNMLIDAGDSDKSNALVNYAKALEITKFDYLIATHQDSDHIGEMQDVFDNFVIDYVYRPFELYDGDNGSFADNFNSGLAGKSGTVSKTDKYYNFLKSVETEKSGWEFYNCNSDFEIKLTQDEKVYSCKFDFLTPTAEKNSIGYSNANNYSPIILLNYCGKKVMFTGDAEMETESELLNYYKNSLSELDVDVLKVGHHGAETSSTKEFLDVIKPEYALSSCGEGNSYYHPRKITLDKMIDANAAIYRTDLQGSIITTINSEGNLSIKTEKTTTSELLFTAPLMPKAA